MIANVPKKDARWVYCAWKLGYPKIFWLIINFPTLTLSFGVYTCVYHIFRHTHITRLTINYLRSIDYPSTIHLSAHYLIYYPLVI